MTREDEQVTDRLKDALAGVVGPRNVLTAPDEQVPFVTDWRGAYSGRALAVVRPGSTDEVSRVVGLCAEAGVAVVPQGGNTGMCGGAVPDESGQAVVLSLSRMNRVLSVDPLNLTMTLQAGCVLQVAQQAALEAGRLFPLSLAAQGSCQIGGNISTNAGGINVLRYGNTRDLVLGLEVVLPDGRVWDGLRGLRKDNRGYDLKHLFIGAEGTLGIVTRAVLKLHPAAPSSATAFVGVADPAAAVRLLARLQGACGTHLSAFELIGRKCLDLVVRHRGERDPFEQRHAWYVLMQLAGGGEEATLREGLEQVLADALAAGDADDAIVAGTMAQADGLWRLRETIPEATVANGPAFRSDIAVATADVPAFIEAAAEELAARHPGAEMLCFGHLGDGNLHFNATSPPDGADWPRGVSEAVYPVVERFNGSFSAEHGVGQAKRAELVRYKSAIEIELMRTIKQALDPRGLMNPGKVL
ncbi:putative FAD-linked oxidoreductase [Variovorax sp. PBL-H6]|uniref:FAD-binding oxidoreductase n=1 Tax=Variovorax sp. PBL-H6 TaxID=434009 RepID=UPI001319606D|nr:FAD-binding oxidoreductase [Variovorax sp. PBL-H6]VTU16237.1 putative FAD-linked oxidoreductase [Variovorax sp. PBL-H6]